MKIEKANICFFSHSSLLGGAERSLLDLMKICVDEGVKCSVVMEGEGALKKECLKYGIEVKTIGTHPWWATISDNDFKQATMNISYMMQKEIDEIIDFVKSQNTDIIYTQTIVNPIGALVSEKLNLPHIWGLREYGQRDHHLKFVFGFNESMSKMYATSDYVLTVSRDVGKVVLGQNFVNKNVFVNYSHVTVPKLYKNQEISILENNIIKIGVFGSIAEGKNQKDAISACMSLLENGYNVKLYLVGQQNKQYMKDLTALVSNVQYKESFIFMDYVEDPYKIMHQMDIVLSCAVSEAMGRTLFEAVLLKKAIIYSNQGGAMEVFIDNEHGLAYELYESGDLADKIAKTIRLPLETKKRVESAFTYVTQTFNKQNFSQAFFKVVEMLQNKEIRRSQNHITEFVRREVQKNLYDFVFDLEQKIQEKEYQVQVKEQKLLEQEQKIQQILVELQEKEQQAQLLTELAQSMRIKNRIKKLLHLQKSDHS